jgi:hypothetical protein
LIKRNSRALIRKFYNSAMTVWALGINHTTAPLDMRGRFAFAMDQIEPTEHGPAPVSQPPARGSDPVHLQPYRRFIVPGRRPTSIP